MSFRPPLDSKHHLSFHDEVGWVEEFAMEEAALLGAASAHDEAGRPGIDGLEQELPDALLNGEAVRRVFQFVRGDEHHGAVGHELRDGHAAFAAVAPFRGHPDGVADVARLELGDDAIGVVYVGKGEVFQPRVAVESGTILTDLKDPRPNLLGGSVDGDGARTFLDAVGDEFIAGPCAIDLGVRGAPAQVERTESFVDKESGGNNAESDKRASQVSIHRNNCDCEGETRQGECNDIIEDCGKRLTANGRGEGV